MTEDFDGCHRTCRVKAAHSLIWGGCEHAVPPEPTVSMSMIYTDAGDGYPSIGFDSYTVAGLAELIAPVINEGEDGFAKPYDDEYGRWLAHKAAHAIVHRNDKPEPDSPRTTLDNPATSSDDPDLYRAQDTLDLVGERCDQADREGRQPTTSDIRTWLKGARCGRELAADTSDSPGVWTPDPPIGCLTVTAERTPSQLPGLRDQLADATVPLLLDTLPKAIARSRGYEVADTVLALLYREWPWLRAVAEDATPPAAT
jgi:hypothetical protein